MCYLWLLLHFSVRNIIIIFYIYINLDSQVVDSWFIRPEWIKTGGEAARLNDAGRPTSDDVALSLSLLDCYGNKSIDMAIIMTDQTQLIFFIAPLFSFNLYIYRASSSSSSSSMGRYSSYIQLPDSRYAGSCIIIIFYLRVYKSAAKKKCREVTQPEESTHHQIDGEYELHQRAPKRRAGYDFWATKRAQYRRAGWELILASTLG